MKNKLCMCLILMLSIELIFSIRNQTIVVSTRTRKPSSKTNKKKTFLKNNLAEKIENIKKVNVHHLNGIWNRIG